MTSSRTSLLSVPSCLVVGAAVLVGGADTVAVPEEVCRVPVVLDLQETRVAVAPVPGKNNMQILGSAFIVHFLFTLKNRKK